LRGSDPAFVSARTLSYDELATAAEELRTRAELTYESQILHHGDPRSSTTLIELVACGTVGAAIVLDGDGEVLEDECVTG
jgi:hypothetical protein